MLQKKVFLYSAWRKLRYLLPSYQSCINLHKMKITTEGLIRHHLSGCWKSPWTARQRDEAWERESSGAACPHMEAGWGRSISSCNEQADHGVPSPLSGSSTSSSECCKTTTTRDRKARLPATSHEEVRWRQTRLFCRSVSADQLIVEARFNLKHCSSIMALTLQKNCWCYFL